MHRKSKLSLAGGVLFGSRPRIAGILNCILSVGMTFVFWLNTPSANAFSLSQFTAGFIEALAEHEAGHELFSQTKDVPITWSKSRMSWTLNQSPTDPKEASNVRLMAMGGLLEQSVSRKVSLEAGWTHTDFQLGRIVYSYGNAFWYAGRQLLSKNGAYHDFAVYERGGGNADRLAVGVLVDVLYDTYRLHHNTKFTEHVQGIFPLRITW